MGAARRRRRVGPTDDWGQLELLCLWPEQRDYELIRPLVLFGSPAAERAGETGAASERTLQCRARRFEAEGVESLFGSDRAGHHQLPPALRRRIVDLKAEYPGFNLNEIANVCYVLFGRRPDHKTVRRGTGHPDIDVVGEPMLGVATTLSAGAGGGTHRS
jgi:hypothetical protein